MSKIPYEERPHGNQDDAHDPTDHTVDRHTFLTHVAETAPPQSTMMAFVGQKDPRATQQYLGSTEAARREMLDDVLRRLEIDDLGIEPDSGASN